MFPIFLLGVATGVILAETVLYFMKSAPSNARFKLQKEQLKNAQADVKVLEEELTKLYVQLEELKVKKGE